MCAMSVANFFQVHYTEVHMKAKRLLTPEQVPSTSSNLLI